MNGRTISIAGLLAALGTALSFARTQGLVSTNGLIWGLGIFGTALMAWLVSWGYTQLYKNGDVPDEDTLNADQKHMWRWRIYQRAVISAALTMGMEGVILLLATASDRQLIVYGVFWAIGSAAVGLSSPFLWWLVFQLVIPWALNANPALGVEIRRGEDGRVESIKDNTQPDARTEILGRAADSDHTGGK